MPPRHTDKVREQIQDISGVVDKILVVIFC